MPKDEFDFDDPMELSGVVVPTEEDNLDLMCECFIEEFMRLGYNPKQILALFRNPHYFGMHMVLQRRGEEFVRNFVAEVFARWGGAVCWAEKATAAHTAEKGNLPVENGESQRALPVELSGASGDPERPGLKAPFALTPALSRWEREPSSPLRKGSASDGSQSTQCEFSLSQRERAGVRENASPNPQESPTTKAAPTITIIQDEGEHGPFDPMGGAVPKLVL